jgi:hypothetical protein
MAFELFLVWRYTMSPRFFSSKVIKALPSYNQAVLAGIKRREEGLPKLVSAAEHTARYLKNSSDYPAFPDLRGVLQPQPGLLYRGTWGFDEVHAVARVDCFEKRKYSDDAVDYDLVAYVRENRNANFLSLSPCIETVHPYAVGLSVIPCLGNIMVTTYPKVFTKPQKLLHLNKPLFTRYDQAVVDSTHIEEVGTYQSISEMTANNNETTAILRGEDGQDWRPVFSTDVLQTILLCGPGRLVTFFMASKQPMQLETWDNPDFKKRALSVEIVLAPSSDLPAMNEKAVELGFIPKGERLLTMKDASAIWKSQDYEQTVVDETLQLDGVPKSIKEGDEGELVDYIQEKLALQTTKAPVSGK